jgi:methionyl-tRNA formyltransferase
LKLIFAGTPNIATTVLQALLESEHEIVAVYTQPDRPAGRGRVLTPSPVKALALQHELPVEQPPNFKEQTTINTLKSYQADAMIVIAYGLILPETVLCIPKYGCLNIHVSLLPKWRGAAPIQHAILAGDTETGVSIMQMDKDLDTGDIYQQVTCPIQSADTSGMLHDRLGQLSEAPLLETLNALQKGTAIATPQNHALTSYAAKISKKDAEIDWNKTATDIDRTIRAYHPWPIAYATFNDQAIRLWKAHIAPSDNSNAPGTILSHADGALIIQTSDQAIAITELQIPGKKALPTSEVLKANSDLLKIGTAL